MSTSNNKPSYVDFKRSRRRSDVKQHSIGEQKRKQSKRKAPNVGIRRHRIIECRIVDFNTTSENIQYFLAQH